MFLHRPTDARDHHRLTHTCTSGKAALLEQSGRYVVISIELGAKGLHVAADGSTHQRRITSHAGKGRVPGSTVTPAVYFA